MKIKKIMAIGMVCTLVLLSAGCASYYRVTDPASGKAYYTDEVDRNRRGVVRFKDAKTGSEVTLQSSEVLEISKEEFKGSTEAQTK